MPTQFDLYQKMLNHQRMQTGLMVGQTALMGHMAGSLHNLHGEMHAIRQMNLQGLAVQQEMLQREQLQSQLEEFIYNTEKLVAEFGNPGCDQPPSVRYFSLKGVAETVEQLGIGTALIRGRDNKAAYEAAMKEVNRIATSLESDPEVVEAIAWAAAEERRLAEDQRKQRAEQQARHDKLSRQIESLKARRRTLSMHSWHQWHQDKFGHLSSSKLTALWLIYGFVWIPAYFLIEQIMVVSRANADLDREIAKLEQELSAA